MIVVVTALATATFAFGCSSSSDDDTGRSPGSSGSTSLGLSLAFASNCAGCHGTTASGQGIYPSLPGNLTLDAFKATVRAGKRAMPAFSTSQISDADLAADYEWMKTKR
jgi:mono/diheme cytochrome c family protein